MDVSNQKKKFWREQIKSRAVEAFGNKCACCGDSFELCCYDFHHLNPNEKDFSLSSVNYNGAKTWLKIRDELKKCILVCANCHRLIHNNLIFAPETSNFNDEYYEWDLTNFSQINEKLEPLDNLNKSEICPNCGKPKSLYSNLCLECSCKKQQTYYISRDDLKKRIRVESFVQIGKSFNVSDNAIRKRCNAYNLPSRKKDINNYSDEEWEKI